MALKKPGTRKKTKASGAKKSTPRKTTQKKSASKKKAAAKKATTKKKAAQKKATKKKAVTKKKATQKKSVPKKKTAAKKASKTKATKKKATAKKVAKKKASKKKATATKTAARRKSAPAAPAAAGAKKTAKKATAKKAAPAPAMADRSLPEVGDPAPDFTLAADDGTTVSLSDLRGKNVVLYFYPRDNTPGCTVEACGFRDAHPDIEAEDAVVLGVSKDSVKSHQGFKAKQNLPFTLLSDPEGEMIQAYGSWGEKKFMGRTSMGILRTTLVIDKDGIVRKVFPKVSVKTHAAEVLDALAQL